MIEPLYFGNPAAPLFGVLNRAPEASALDHGVLICAPLGYENVIYYRQLAILARRLAAAGRSTIRFDWPGCGDSAGDDRQPGLVAAYLEAVTQAVSELRTHTGVDHVDIVGLRIGATIAAAAAKNAGAADLVLWDPFVSGRSYVRSMRAFDKLSHKQGEDADPLVGDGQAASGFVIARSTIQDLARIDLTKLELGAPRRILLAGRDAPPDEALVDHFEALGHDVTSTVFEGLREVALGWTERPVPVESFAQIESWLAPAEPRAERSTLPVPVTGAKMAVGGAQVDEQSILLTEPSPMLGIVTTPSDRPHGDSWIVFLPNRYARRIGPNRLYTEWARSWAAEGVPSLRIDVNGTGDAGGPDEETDRDMYRPEAVLDVTRSAAYLRTHHGAQRFAVIGLCSGGYIGFHGALEDASIEEAILLNPQMLLWTDQETPVARAGILLRGSFRLSSWRKVLDNRGAMLKAVLPVAGEALISDIRWRASRLTGRSRDRAGLSIRAWIIDALNLLEARKARVLFVFSEGDAGLGYLARHLGKDLVGLADRDGVSLEVVAGADHTFRRIDKQFALHDLLKEHLAAAGFVIEAEDPEQNRQLTARSLTGG